MMSKYKINVGNLKNQGLIGVGVIGVAYIAEKIWEVVTRDKEMKAIEKGRISHSDKKR